MKYYFIYYSTSFLFCVEADTRVTFMKIRISSENKEKIGLYCKLCTKNVLFPENNCSLILKLLFVFISTNKHQFTCSSTCARMKN